MSVVVIKSGGKLKKHTIAGIEQPLPSAVLSPTRRPHEPEGRPPLPEPTLAQMAANFAAAMADWLKAGAPVVAEPTFAARLAICRACTYWDESARLGAGKCKHPSCGCSKAKHWLRTSRCPLHLWPAP